MELTVLGNSSRYLVPLGSGTSYLLEHGEDRVLLDAGNGTHLRLKEVLGNAPLTGVIVSHFHLDAAADLLTVLMALEPGTPVFLPARALPRLRDLLGAWSMDESWIERARVTPVGANSRHEVGGLALRFAHSHHGCPSVSVRIEGDGRALTYLSDTGYRPWLPDLARDADLLLAHTLLLDKDADGEVGETNLSAGAAGRLAAEARAKRLALSHIPFYLRAEDSVAEARAHYDGDVFVLHERESYSV